MSTRERRLRSDKIDASLVNLFDALGATSQGVSLAAVGGYGRGELSPGSDLDLIFIHRSKDQRELSEIVNSILYPLWDQGLSIDHSVRTMSESLELAKKDIRVAMGLLDIRLICGDPDPVASLQSENLELWRRDSRRYLQELKESMRIRHEKSGELAYLLEPDLKEARGGLRDINSIKCIARSDVRLPTLERIATAESTLLKIRDSLHTLTGNSKDRLFFHEQDTLAEVLGYADADVLMAEVAKSARSIDYLLRSIWHGIEYHGKDRLGRFMKKVRTTALTEDILISHQEVALSVDAPISIDATLSFKVAAAASQIGLPLSMETSALIGQKAPPLSTPWPRIARENFVSLTHVMGGEITRSVGS